MATLTGANVEYEGSITISRDLLKAANMYPYEKVLVSNAVNGSRLETYIIEGEPGVIELNGAAALLGKPGERVIIMSFTQVEQTEAKSWHPDVVYVNSKNEQIKK